MAQERVADARGETGIGDVRLDWPDRDGPSAPAQQSGMRLAWGGEGEGGSTAVTTPAAARDADPADDLAPGRPVLVIRTRRSPAEAPDVADPHDSCRSEIERLEAEVAELRQQVRELSEISARE